MCKFWMAVVLGVSMATLTLISVAAATDQQTVKVGKQGEIMLKQETKFGDITLKPGHYQIQHRMAGWDHIIYFTKLNGVHRNPNYQSEPTSTSYAGEVKCHLEPLKAEASQTVVNVSTEGGVQRITRIEIQGENVAHVF